MSNLHVLTFITILIARNVICEQWTQLPGYAVQISAKGDELWAVTSSRNGMRWSGSGWTYVHSVALFQVAAFPGGAWLITAWAWYSGADTRNLWRAHASGDFPTAIRSAIHVNAISAQSAVILQEDGMIYKLNNGVFENLNPKDRNNWRVAIGDNDEMWKLDPNGAAYRYVSGNWQIQTGIKGKHVDVQNASRVVITGDDDFVWAWNGRIWTRYTDKECAQATINYNSIFCVDRKERIWKLIIENDSSACY